MNDAMRGAMESGLKMMRMFIEHDPTHPTMAHAFVTNLAGEMIVMAFENDFFGSADGKDRVAAIVMAKLVQMRGVAVFVSDAWGAKVGLDYERGKMPDSLSDWPAEMREEILFCTANMIGEQGVTVHQPYGRDANGKPIWGEICWNMEGAIETRSRFAFDLRPGTRHRMVIDIAIEVAEKLKVQ